MSKQIPDITARLTTWCHTPQAESAQDLMDEAASEIERLRTELAFHRKTLATINAVHAFQEMMPRLPVTEPMTKKKWAEVPLHPTDEERRVLCELRDSYASEDDQECNQIAEVLDGLLERTK
jgi:hypothetical protein